MEMTNLDKPKTSRPAIQQEPLPQAGDSLKEELNALLWGKVYVWSIAAMLAVVYAGLDWWRYLAQITPQLGPTIFGSVLALGVLIVTLVKVSRAASGG